MLRLLTALAALLTALTATPALADVQMTFHSFNGSVFFGRYPHAFVSLDGTLEDGTRVKENYGFTAKRATTAVLRGPVEHTIQVEEDKYLTSTNRHFTVTLDDAQVARARALMRRWRDAPGKYYNLDTRSCIHFVGEMAKIAGLQVSYPKKMLRRPKQWLNHIAALNPGLKAKAVR